MYGFSVCPVILLRTESGCSLPKSDPVAPYPAGSKASISEPGISAASTFNER